MWTTLDMYLCMGMCISLAAFCQSRGLSGKFDVCGEL